MIKNSVCISIKGLVQGVGFRPFIYRLAQKHQLKGNVTNRSDGVVVKVHGDENVIEKFQQDIIRYAPHAALIKNISSVLIDENSFSDFKILPSEKNDLLDTEISPDIAVCSDCLNDLKTQKHRINYPFINCTNCGPRFSIIKGIPYDRVKTTMDTFEMCTDCHFEYHNVDDRRFHAQPVACNFCGPKYQYQKHQIDESDFTQIIKQIASQLKNGDVLAIKGLGGYHLICDAQNQQSVKRIRKIKEREAKPFAVMFRNIHAVEQFCLLNANEQKELESWRRPIVILDEKKQLCHSVNQGIKSLGVILPYLPLHYLLFEYLEIPAIVFTSANRSEEPLIANDALANDQFYRLTDGLLSHNREIYNPLDDSVVKLNRNSLSVIRRSRGYVPTPVELNRRVDSILATGAEQKNTFCLGKEYNAILSQHIGDLKNYETYQFYIDTIEKFFDLFHFNPQFIVCDMHPAYLTTKFANEFVHLYLKDDRSRIIQVQHHHAHIASCLAEHQIEQNVIGVSFDGTGYGTDGKIWGGEFLICDTKSFQRFAHFDYIKMPGGDHAAKEPWRMALAYLEKYFGHQGNWTDLRCFKNVNQQSISLLRNMLQNNVNSPLTSSAGRLFDAVACILNLCTENSFDAEAPMRLESIIDKSVTESYPYQVLDKTIKFDCTLEAIISDIDKIPVTIISAKFHNTIINSIIDLSEMIRKETGINKVVLSGGVFQNGYLLGKSMEQLKSNKFNVYTNEQVPANDGGIAIGQLIVASNNI